MPVAVTGSQTCHETRMSQKSSHVGGVMKTKPNYWNTDTTPSTDYKNAHTKARQSVLIHSKFVYQINK
jgi:hypothetical protein